MQILFVHQNFPGQFKHLAPALAQRGHDVKALTLRPEAPAAWQGVDIVRYTPQRGNAPGIHPWVLDFESKVIRGEAVFRAALEMKSQLYASIGIMAGSYAHNIKNLLVRPNDLLARMWVAGVRVVDVPVRPIYGPLWRSGISLRTAIYPVLFVVVRSFVWRVSASASGRAASRVEAC